jgi:hypothetical protein
MMPAAMYQFPARPPRARSTDDDGQVLRRRRVLAEVPGFLRAVSEARALRPDIPHVAWVAAGRSEGGSLRYVPRGVALARALEHVDGPSPMVAR